MEKLQDISSAASQAVSAGIVMLLVSCSVESFNGTIPTVEPKEEEPAAILVAGQGSNSISATRAAGSDAATMLGGTFRVFGASDKGKVFDNYVVKWTGTPGSTTTDLAGWEYQGYMSKAEKPALQNIKFWDESAAQYDFIAFAGIADDEHIDNTTSNTIGINTTNMHTMYIADRISARPAPQTAKKGISPEYIGYKQQVKFTFRRASARMRIGFYETIPGYAVKDLRFYYGDNVDAQRGTSTKTTVAMEGIYPDGGEYTVSYDNDNVAYTRYDADGDTKSYRELGTLTYGKGWSSQPSKPHLTADGYLTTEGDDVYIGATSATASHAVCDEIIDGTLVHNSIWHPILPFEENDTPLQLRVDYTLVSIDGSGEIIRVTGAKATVPCNFCHWKPNFSYIYIFKISNKSGYTDTSNAPEGLYPITFDATVSSIQENVVHEEKL